MACAAQWSRQVLFMLLRIASYSSIDESPEKKPEFQQGWMWKSLTLKSPNPVSSKGQNKEEWEAFRDIYTERGEKGQKGGIEITQKNIKTPKHHTK